MNRISSVVWMCSLMAGLVAFGGMDIYIPVGTPEGGGTVRMLLRWDDPKVIPDIPIKPIENGRMEVKRGNPTYLRFYQTGVETPVREYVMTTGDEVFSLTSFYHGRKKETMKWIYQRDGTCVLEKYSAAGTLLSRSSRREIEEGARLTVFEKEGDVVSETVYENLPGFGNVKVFEAKGTGPDRVWTRTAHYRDGPEIASVRSIIDSDGYWEMREYGQHPTKQHGTNGNAVVRMAVITPLGGARGVTNAEGRVVSFVGKALRTEYGYQPVDPHDDGVTSDHEPRTVVTCEVTPDGGRKELSRVYSAYWRDKKTGKRHEITEEATVPGAPYGAASSRRTVEVSGLGPDGFSTVSIDPRGVMKCELSVSFPEGPYCGVDESFETTTNAPGGTPFKTIITRRYLRQYVRLKRVAREERWILLPENDRELVSWTNFERDDSGREIRTVTSNGDSTETSWELGEIVRHRDADGLERHWRFDDIGRLVRSEASVYDSNLRYDLGSLVTNVYGSVYGRTYDYSFGYDDAGRVANAGGAPGEKWETRTDGDGVERTRINGRLVRSVVKKDGVTTVYEGPKGLASPRWRKCAYDEDGRFAVLTMPKVGGGTRVVTNRFELTRELDASQVETDTRYRKVKGCWWREEAEFRVSGTNRTALGGRRTRMTGRRRDGADEFVTFDEKGHETEVLKFRNALAKTSTEVVRRPTATQPELIMTSNGVEVLKVSSSGITNAIERGFQGRILSTTDGRGGVTRYEYDRQGRCVAQTDRNGRHRRFAYDRQDRRISEILPSGRTVRSTYDEFGRLKEVAAAREVVRYAYDDYGDLESATTTRDGKPIGTLVYCRDEATGLVTNRVANGTRVEFTYSDDNELLTAGGVDIRALAVALTNGLEFVRDDFGRAIGYSVCGISRSRQEYDPRTGRLAAISVPELGEVRVSYLQGTDLVEELAYPDGVTARFSYDAEERPLRVVWRGLPDGSRTIEAEAPAEWELPRFDDSPELDKLPIKDDPQVYVLEGTALAWPVACRDAEGRLRWCLLDAKFKRVGLHGGKEAK